MKKWTLIFFDGTSVELYTSCQDDPQHSAIEIILDHPYLTLIAAVPEGTKILIRDSGRTAECAFQEWPCH